MKSKSKEEMELVGAGTDLAVMALVDWTAMTQPAGAMTNLVYGLFILHQARDGGVSREEVEHALNVVNESALELTGRVWGRDEAGKLRVAAISQPVEVGGSC